MRLIDADKLKEKKVRCNERAEWVVPVAEIDWMPTIEERKNGKWTPCSEGLPKEDGSYWVCGRWSSGKVAVGDCEYSTDDGYFLTAWNFDVIAWMPLPEPYREDDND